MDRQANQFWLLRGLHYARWLQEWLLAGQVREGRSLKHHALCGHLNILVLARIRLARNLSYHASLLSGVPTYGNVLRKRDEHCLQRELQVLVSKNTKLGLHLWCLYFDDCRHYRIRQCTLDEHLKNFELLLALPTGGSILIS